MIGVLSQSQPQLSLGIFVLKCFPLKLAQRKMDSCKLRLLLHYVFEFGLGDSGQIEQIEMQWPSGRRWTITHPTPLNSTNRRRSMILRKQGELVDLQWQSFPCFEARAIWSTSLSILPSRR
ncbi:MAG: hypothetical protein DMG05_08360 [Acidobacteria bacterium]|nr:MAG: hypothetical protein DMG05_08360 [Acidobacteriota bacterium]